MVEIEVFQRADKRYDWKMTSGGNHEEMCGSLQGYESYDGALAGFLRCLAPLIEGKWHLEPRADAPPSEDV